MSFCDSTDMTHYLTVAANLTTGTADYTPENSNGKYDTRWMLCDEEESDYWMRKWETHRRRRFIDRISTPL